MTQNLQSSLSKSQSKLNLITSVTDLINQKQKFFKQTDIKKLFQIKQLPSFAIYDLKQNIHLTKYDSFNALLSVLVKWNHKIQNKKYSPTCRSQFFRNQFIFLSLKTIFVQNDNVQKNLTQLYNWYRKNSNNKAVIIPSNKKMSSFFDQDWIIRKNFISNMPAELTNYRRREIINQKQNFFQDNQYIRPATSKDIPLKQMVSNSILTWAQYKFYQQQQKRKRQQQQIQKQTSKWKLSKSRFQQTTSKNYYKYQFNSTETFSQLKKKNNNHYKSTLIAQKNNSLQKVKLVRLRRKIFGLRTETKQMSISDSKSQIQPLTIDDLRLVSNPFEALNKKKRKRKAN